MVAQKIIDDLAIKIISGVLTKNEAEQQLQIESDRDLKLQGQRDRLGMFIQTPNE